jgi:hypothetical protein
VRRSWASSTRTSADAWTDCFTKGTVL